MPISSLGFRSRNALATALLLCASLQAAQAAVVPAGFSDTEVKGGLNQPVSFDFAPNGDIFVGEKEGAVKIIRGGNVILAGQIAVPTIDEMGISGIAVDPDFSSNGHLWVYRANLGLNHQLSRYTVVNDTLTSELVVLQVVNFATFHHAGCIRFAADGTLFLSTGEDQRSEGFSQNPFSLHGKILHINRDGTPAAGNPFLSGVAGDPRVWALGLRHPYRFSIEPGTGNLFIADIGNGLWEELDLGLPGANYGFPLIEGFQPPGLPGYVYPIHAYLHSGELGNSIIGGQHAEAGDLAPDNEGHYFYGDEAAMSLRRLVLDSSYNVVQDEVWATQVEHPVEIRFGPDGALYYAAFFIGSIRKVSFVGGANRAPLASGVALPASGPAPLSVVLDGTASSDPDEDILAYAWNSGDGATGTNPTLAHVYPAGVFTAQLTVNDGGGGVDTTPGIRVVSGNRAPTANITAPVDEAFYNAGAVINYAGTGTDPENGTLSCPAFAWTVTFHHLGHTHPQLGPVQGSCGGSFTIPQTGETSASTFYQIRLEVQDNGAPLGSNAILTHNTAVQIRPHTTEFTLATSPNPNLTLTLDGGAFTAPQTVTGVVNFLRTIGAPGAQIGADGRTYTFASWSDSGAATHTITTPAAPATFTASFTCNVITEVANLRVAPAAGGQVTLTWDPVGDFCAVAGSNRYRIYSAATPRPATLPGQFPTDPAFALAGSTGSASFTFLPPAGDRFFLVVAVGTDAQEGPVGHYGE